MKVVQRVIIGILLCAAPWGEAIMVTFSVSEEGVEQPLPCRIHVFNAAGEPHEPPDYPFFRDHFSCDGQASIDLAAGDYSYIVAHGPEYSQDTGEFTVDQEPVAIACALHRIVDLKAEGYLAGDLHIHRPLEDIELLIDAEGLDVAPVISWWNNKNMWEDKRLPKNPLRQTASGRYIFDMVGEDERNGGALMYYHLDAPLPIQGAGKDFPPMSKYGAQGKKLGAWLDIEKPFWWDVPIFVAHGLGDSIGLANNHMCRATMYEDEAWGFPRDAVKLPPPRGNGFWTQEIYYHLLNTGHRIPPSAGSASGVLPNPVGYNRVYVQVGEDPSWENWWKQLKAGRSFVTNGPLLRVQANGDGPGTVFKAQAGESIILELTAELDGRDTVPAFEIIQDGASVRRVPVATWKETGSLGTIAFEQSGWCIVRVVAKELDTFRFASTAPFYVQIGDDTRLSKTSAQFFLHWLTLWPSRVQEEDPDKRAAAMKYHEKAVAYWEQKLQQANAE